jgi:hypothetical protein
MISDDLRGQTAAGPALGGRGGCLQPRGEGFVNTAMQKSRPPWGAVVSMREEVTTVAAVAQRSNVSGAA